MVEERVEEGEGTKRGSESLGSHSRSDRKNLQHGKAAAKGGHRAPSPRLPLPGVTLPPGPSPTLSACSPAGVGAAPARPLSLFWSDAKQTTLKKCSPPSPLSPLSLHIVRRPPPLARPGGPVPGPVRQPDHGGAGGGGRLLCVSFGREREGQSDRQNPRRAPRPAPLLIFHPLPPPLSLLLSRYEAVRPKPARRLAEVAGLAVASSLALVSERGRARGSRLQDSPGTRTHSTRPTPSLSPQHRASAPSSRCCGQACTCEHGRGPSGRWEGVCVCASVRKSEGPKKQHARARRSLSTPPSLSFHGRGSCARASCSTPALSSGLICHTQA